MILYALYNVLVHAATHHGGGVVRAIDIDKKGGAVEKKMEQE